MVTGCRMKGDMESMAVNKPDFMIIGAMKCATSTLHDQLNMHSSFFMTEPKEPNFFSDDEVYEKGLAWYGTLFDGAEEGQLRGESSTHYTKLPVYPHTLERLADFCPRLKCIYIMRQPVQRLISHYIHEWTQGVISCDINGAIDEFPELIDYSRYAMQLEPFLKTYGKDSILPLFAERLRANPLAELQRVFEFLEVDEKAVWQDTIQKNVSSERMRVCGWRDTLLNNSFLRIIRQNLVPKKVRTRIQKFWTMNERPELAADVQQRVENVLNQDLKRLGEALGLELNCDNFSQVVVTQERIDWATKV